MEALNEVEQRGLRIATAPLGPDRGRAALRALHRRPDRGAAPVRHLARGRARLDHAARGRRAVPRRRGGLRLRHGAAALRPQHRPVAGRDHHRRRVLDLALGPGRPAALDAAHRLPRRHRPARAAARVPRGPVRQRAAAAALGALLPAPAGRRPARGRGGDPAARQGARAGRGLRRDRAAGLGLVEATGCAGPSTASACARSARTSRSWSTTWRTSTPRRATSRRRSCAAAPAAPSTTPGPPSWPASCASRATTPPTPAPAPAAWRSRPCRARASGSPGCRGWTGPAWPRPAARCAASRRGSGRTCRSCSPVERRPREDRARGARPEPGGARVALTMAGAVETARELLGPPPRPTPAAEPEAAPAVAPAAVAVPAAG